MKLTQEEIARCKQESVAPAKDVLERLYQAVLRTPEITLSDGTKARVEAYYAPEVDDGGELNCGIDVRLDNGTELEFTVTNTGWGKSFAAELAAQKRQQGRRRG